LKHASKVSSYYPYAHEKIEDEVFKENYQDWDEVVERMVDPKMTRFRAMSLDEHMTILEKLAQEALRAREEMIVAEAAEAPLIALV
jgi:acyl-CoA reductase-like NAD-dependent aldehyde dehydrogenase